MIFYFVEVGARKEMGKDINHKIKGEIKTGNIMTSDEQRFEQVKNKIAESEKPERHAKKSNVEAAIGEMKKELSGLNDEPGASQQKTTGKFKIVVILVVIVLIVLIVGTKLIGLW